MLELDGSIWLRSGSQTWGGQHRIDLLAQIAATGSLTAAARAVGMSYKGAWDAIDAMNNLAGEALVLRAAGGKGGGGTRLTDRAKQLIRSFRILQAEHQRFMQHLARTDLNTGGDLALLRRFMLKTSARNQLVGTINAVRPGAVHDEIELVLPGGLVLVATITHASTLDLGLRPGQEAIALIKASSVIVGVSDGGLRLSARNQLPGIISALHPGAVNSEVIIELDGGGTVAAIITRDSAQNLKLAVGEPACAIIKASSIIIGVMD